ATALPDETEAEHKPGVSALANQTARHSLQRAGDHFHDRADFDERARIVAEIAHHQRSKILDFLIRNRRGLPVRGHELHDAAAFQDDQRVRWIDPYEAVAGKQRPVDPLSAILPAAPSRDRRQKSLEAFSG